MNKLDLINIKQSFFNERKKVFFIKTMKRQATAWEKILADHLCDKGFVSRINKRLLKTKFNNK